MSFVGGIEDRASGFYFYFVKLSGNRLTYGIASHRRIQKRLETYRAFGIFRVLSFFDCGLEGKMCALHSRFREKHKGETTYEQGVPLLPSTNYASYTKYLLETFSGLGETKKKEKGPPKQPKETIKCEYCHKTFKTVPKLIRHHNWKGACTKTRWYVLDFLTTDRYEESKQKLERTLKESYEILEGLEKATTREEVTQAHTRYGDLQTVVRMILTQQEDIFQLKVTDALKRV